MCIELPEHSTLRQIADSTLVAMFSASARQPKSGFSALVSVFPTPAATLAYCKFKEMWLYHSEMVRHTHLLRCFIGLVNHFDYCKSSQGYLAACPIGYNLTSLAERPPRTSTLSHRQTVVFDAHIIGKPLL